MTSKSPFLLSFVAGVYLSVVVIGALAFVFIFAWRYYHRRHKIEPSSKEIPLTTLEDGRPRPTSYRLDFSPHSPSRLGGNSPSSAEKTDEAWEPLRQFLTQTGTTNDAQNDAQRPLSVISQSSPYIIYPVTTEVVDSERVHNHPIRAKVIPDPTTSEGGNMYPVEHYQAGSFISLPPPRIPHFAPFAPPKSNGRLSISTVWIQESTWPREKVPDVPVPPLAHLPVTRRVVVYTPYGSWFFKTGARPASASRSVGPSDFEEDF